MTQQQKDELFGQFEHWQKARPGSPAQRADAIPFGPWKGQC